ncbi:MAG: single-stranded DNA-binding protein [Clostridia bacterium]
MNKVFLIGNLTRDPETSTTSNGYFICKFSIAVQRSFANANGEKEADFFNIVTWRGLAETCSKWLEKGKKVAVSGSIQTRTYEAQDGSKRNVFEIQADEVEFLTPRSGDSQERKPYDSQEKPADKKAVNKVNDLEPMDDDTLPF